MNQSIWPDGDQTSELLSGAREGNAEAVDELLDKHRESLRRMINLRLDQRIKRRIDVSDVVQDVLIEASHDGYDDTVGLVHRRLLYVSGDGGDIRGEDILIRSPQAAMRGGHSFAVRFHLHPGVRASLAAGGDSVILRLPSGDGWRFRAAGGRPQLEESVYLGAPGAPRRCQQIVVRGAVNGDGATVKWRLGREAWDPKAASGADPQEAS